VKHYRNYFAAFLIELIKEHSVLAVAEKPKYEKAPPIPKGVILEKREDSNQSHTGSSSVFHKIGNFIVL
jgi:hypothetical protein